MENAGEIYHINGHYLAIFGDYSRTRRNQRHQSEPSVLQPTGQIEYREECCFPERDYAHE